LEQPSKILFPTEETLEPKVIFNKFSQESKAESSIVVTLLGITIYVISFSLKVSSPIVTTPEGTVSTPKINLCVDVSTTALSSE